MNRVLVSLRGPVSWSSKLDFQDSGYRWFSQSQSLLRGGRLCVPPATSQGTFKAGDTMLHHGKKHFSGAALANQFPKYSATDKQLWFEQTGDILIKTMIENLPCGMPGAEKQWVQDMLEYNVKGGKMNRGLMVVESGAALLNARGKVATSDQFTELALLGWALEWVQAWMLMADDLMDSSETRRGKPCWYKQDHVKLVAVNDALLLESLVYRVLKLFFQHQECYPQLLELFQETTYNTELGQLADTRCESLCWEEFTVERFDWVAEYKTSFYSFYCPVALGMIYAGVTESHVFETAKRPLIKMGIYFQVQDDYLDCFATAEDFGKIGTDIQDRKCSWLFAHALSSASSRQREILEAHVGKCKAGSDGEQEVKKVYKELKLDERYNAYAAKSFDEITNMRAHVEAAGLPWSIFELFLNKIHGRRK